MSDIIWETFDGLFKTLHRQGRRVEELEQRVVELERRLNERSTTPAEQTLRFEEPKESLAEVNERIDNAQKSDALAD